MSEELTAEELYLEWLNLNDIDKSIPDHCRWTGFHMKAFAEEYAKAKTEEKDNDIEVLKLVNQGFREANISLGEEVDLLQKEVERLSEFEKFCSVGAAKIVNDHVKTKAENKKFKNLSYNDWIKLATPSGVIILLEAFGYDWEDDYNDYEEFGNAVEELIKN